MSRWRIAGVLVQFVFAVLSFEVAAKPALRVVFPDDYYPFYYRDAAGDYKGASFEIVSQLCRNLGYDVKVTQLSSMRLMLDDLGSGKQDVSVNLTTTPERAKVALFTSVPHIYESQNLISRADNNVNFQGRLIDLSRYRFGPILGWTYGPQFDNAEFLNKAYVNNSVDQLKGLLSGRFDFAINNPLYFRNMALKLGVSRAFKVLEPAVFTLPVTIGVSRQYPQAAQLVQDLEQELVRFQAQAAYKEILTRYGFEPAQMLGGDGS
ncbi:substrate-binding periplasmic protein [Vibrio sp.]|uniref:substrate-binding periplasmic protein n=1 Tax=Vibrio sp. TaxID=678 RepID=UPI003D150684